MTEMYDDAFRYTGIKELIASIGKLFVLWIGVIIVVFVGVKCVGIVFRCSRKKTEVVMVLDNIIL